MLKFLKTALGAAGIAYAATHMLYGDAVAANFGFAEVQTVDLQKIVPAIAAVVVPIIASKYAAASEMATLLLNLFKYKSPAKADMLGKVAALEVYGADNEKIKTACATLRHELTA